MAQIETYAVPTSLYRYRSLGFSHGSSPEYSNLLLDREIAAIKSGIIFCPNYSEMNDPMEGIYRSSKSVRNLENYEQVVEDLFQQKNKTGIASFSETWDNEIMWAHYADKFHGICIKYSVRELLNYLPDTCALARVFYGDRPQLVNKSLVQRKDVRARAALSSKSYRWAYEREWRLFAECRGPVDCGQEAIKRVYLGARMSSKDRRHVKEQLAGFDIEIRKTKIEGYTISH